MVQLCIARLLFHIQWKNENFAVTHFGSIVWLHPCSILNHNGRFNGEKHATLVGSFVLVNVDDESVVMATKFKF